MSILFTIISGVSVTAGAHRLFTHRSYKATWQLRLLLIIVNYAAMQNSVYEWCRDHRAHHKFVDTDADPHNVKRGAFFAHMGWLMVKKLPDVKIKGKQIDMSDLENDPIVMFQKKYYKPILPIFFIILPTIIMKSITGDTTMNCIFLGTILRYVLQLHGTWLINSAAHIYGMRPYDKNIQATDSVFVATLAFGEGWHNYHHVFPWDYKTSELGDYKYNLTTAFIDLMAKIGWAYDLKTVSDDMIVKRAARTGDGSNEYSKCLKRLNETKNYTSDIDYDDDSNSLVWGWDDPSMSDNDKNDALIFNKLD